MIAPIDNGEKGLSVRTKLNTAISKVNDHDGQLTTLTQLAIDANETANQAISDAEGAANTANLALANTVPVQILAATTKETPAEADVFGYVNSAETENGQLRKFTWANLKASLKTYFDGIYSTFFPTTSGDGSKFLSDAGDYREAGGLGTIPISPSVATRNEAGQITKNIVTVSEGVTIESRFNYADGIMTFFEIKNQVTGEWKRVTINYTEAVYTSKTVEIIEAWTI